MTPINAQTYSYRRSKEISNLCKKAQIATPRALQKLSMQLHTLPTIMLAVVGCDVNYNSYKNAYLTEDA